MNKNKRKLKQVLTILLFIIIITIGAYFDSEEENKTDNIIENNKISYEILNVPEYSDEIYVEINGNNPEFSEEDMNLEKDYYSNLENGRVRNGNDKN